MTQDERKVIELALDLATMHHTDAGYDEFRLKVRQLGKEALAQPEQKPVAYTNGTDVILAKHWTADYPPEGWEPLGYTTPPQRKPLTDEEIEATFTKCGGKWNGDQWVIEDADLHPFVRTIEHPELNTLRAISDEYNAWIRHDAAGHDYDDFLAKRLAATWR
jgi:hypothetical protein